VLLLFALWLARNVIVNYAFTRLVKVETNDKVHFSINDLNFDVWSQNVLVDSLNLTFDSVYIDSTRRSTLESLKFAGVSIEKFDILSLLFKKQIIADRLIFIKPDIFIITDGGGKAEIGNPEKVLEIIENSSSYSVGVKAHIGSVELRYGQIDISDKKDPAVKFTTKSLSIFLDDFNTIEKKKWVTGREFFSHSLYLKAAGLYKSFHSHYSLTIDSLVWFSGKYNLDAYGFRFLPLDSISDSIMQLKVSAKRLKAAGFHLRGDTISSASVRKLVLNDGSVRIRQSSIKSDSGKKSSKKSAFIFKLISADTLLLNRNKLFIENGSGDTALFFNNLNLKLEQLKVDSMFFIAPEKHFDYSSFNFSTDAFVSNTLMEGVHIQSGTISYNSKWKKFVLDEFLMRDTLQRIHFHSGRIKLNLSLKSLLHKKNQKFDVVMIKPFAKVDFDYFSDNHNRDTIGLFKTITPHNIKIVKGSLDAIWADGANALKLKDVTVLTNNFRFNISRHLFNYDTLSLRVAVSSYSKRGRYGISSGSLKFNGRDFIGNSLFYNNYEDTARHIKLHGVLLKSFQLTDLIQNKTLIADSVILLKPQTLWETILHEKSKTDTVFSIAKILRNIEKPNNIKVMVNHLEVRNGNIDLKIISPKSTTGFFTNYSIKWNHFWFGHFMDRPFSNLKGLELDLWNTYHFNNNIRTEIGKLSAKSDNGYFGIENINIFNNDTTSKNKWDIQSLSLKYIGFRNFDFQHFLGNDEIIFDKLLIDNPIADVAHNDFEKYKKKKSNKPYTFGFAKVLPFNVLFDTIEVRNMYLHYVLNNTLGTSQYRVKDVDLVYSGDGSIGRAITSASLLKNLDFSFDSLYVTDTVSGIQMGIGNGMLNSKDSSFSLFGLTMDAGKNLTNKTRISSDTVIFYKISVTDTMPSLFSMKQLWFSQTKLTLYDGVNNQQATDARSSLKFASLYRYSKLFRRFTIDTILFSDIDVVSFNDFAVKKWGVNNVKLRINRFQVFPQLALDTMPLRVENVSAELYNRKFVTGDSLYEISAQHLLYNHLNKAIYVDSISIKPLFDTLQFFQKNRWQTDRINLFMPSVKLLGFDLNDWNEKGLIHFSQVFSEGLQARLYRDKSFPRDTLIRPLLQGMLQKVKQPFIIDTLALKNSYLRYGEKDSIYDKPGYVYFTDINFNGINITNTIGGDESAVTKLFADAKLMGDAVIHTKFNFPLSANQGKKFWFSVKSENIDLTTLNPITQNLSGLTILKGKGSVDIPLVTASDTLAIGSMLFKYHGLRVSLFDRKKARQANGISAPLVRFVLNDLVLRSNNPNWFKRPRLGVVYFKRDRNKAIANYIWKSTLSGALSTMGFNNKEQRKRRKKYRKQEFEIQHNTEKKQGYGR